MNHNHKDMAHGSGNGHDKHEGHSPAMFRDRFWLSLLLSLPVIYFS
jgi:Cu2+-exporting ATPase